MISSYVIHHHFHCLNHHHDSIKDENQSCLCLGLNKCFARRYGSVYITYLIRLNNRERCPSFDNTRIYPGKLKMVMETASNVKTRTKSL